MDFRSAIKRSGYLLLNILPMLIGVLMIVSFLKALIPPESYQKVFTGNILLDPLIGAVIGSISAGNP
ncbi:MAG: hypothetical protein R6V53_02260, partial [Candidatus Woesearchaeota archaeon]